MEVYGYLSLDHFCPTENKNSKHLIQKRFGDGNRNSVGFSGSSNNGTPYPYYFHTTPIRIPKDMGMVWVPLVWVPQKPFSGVPGVVGSPG